MIKTFKKIIWFSILSIVLVIGYKDYKAELLEGPEAPEAISLIEVGEQIEDQARTNINIDMPFYTQAPHSNWDYPWQETCEEASVLLVANVFNELYLDLEDYNTELLRLVDWEMEIFGSYEHTTIEQTTQMMTENYGLETVVHENPSFEDIQEILNQGNLIIAPFAGKLLGNPNFRNGGPTYHMLVIKGYDSEKMQIVTHDVGTRNGENYVYEWSTIEAALHDWHDDDILEGTPRLIEVVKP
ncbi:MAG: hypothetical protein ACI9QC_000204 [Oceanicoccus sp.]|jgi:hypothetical protein